MTSSDQGTHPESNFEHKVSRIKDVSPSSLDQVPGVELGPPLIGSGTLKRLPRIVESLSGFPPVLVTDQNVSRLHARRVLRLLPRGVGVIEIPPGEASKSLRQAGILYDKLAEMKAGRSTPLIALGGGVVTDLAGFAASTFMRGIPLILVPTSLLAQADAAIGGKTGVNLRAGKNLVGAFYPAAATVVDFDFLHTLPAREFRNGFSEIVKMCILGGEKKFYDLEQLAGKADIPESRLFRSLLKYSISAKLEIVRQDPKEISGRRSLLNLGHTFAHGLEAASNYKVYTHGEAVAVGLAAACRLAEEVNGFPPKLTGRIQSILLKFGLPARYSKPDPEKIYAAMMQDKKRTRTLRFVLPVKLGKAELRENIPDYLVMRVLGEMRK